jgi:hypothetical protein
MAPSLHSLNAQPAPALHALHTPEPLHTPPGHAVPADSFELALQTGAPLAQLMLPLTQTFPFGRHASPALQAVHAPAPLHTPPLHPLPAPENPSAGHNAACPVHTSATSQALAAPRQVAPFALSASAGQSAEAPLHFSATSHTAGASRHNTDGPSSVQSPSAVAPNWNRHASHAPLQALSQQTPSAQCPLWQLPSFTQAVPLGRFTAQSAFSGLQNVPLGHSAGAFGHGIGQSTSLPLHTTVPPQAGLPSAPLASAVQMPTVPAFAHPSQAPAQAESQHTPSTQNPLLHSGLLPQVWASSFCGSHFPLAAQTKPDAHVLEVHFAGQVSATPSHRKGEQLGSPALPSAFAVHTPVDDVTLHASHAPSQALLQHTPSAQNPD